MGKKTSSKKLSDRVTLFRYGVKFLALYLCANFFYQLYRKPTEVFSLLGLFKAKTPAETWSAYRSHFVETSTDIVTPDFLAALAQTESAGNPWASPPWRVTLNSKLFQIYTPMTSAVGLYQFVDETFARALTRCIDMRFHRSPANERCPANVVFRTRLSAQSSTQLAAAYLDQEVREILGSRPANQLSLEKKQTLASIVHLCGGAKAALFYRSGFSWKSLGRCGAHDPQTYTQKLLTLKRTFSGYLDREPQRSLAAVR